MDHSKAQNYSIIVHKKNNQFYCSVPGTCLITQSESLEKSHELILSELEKIKKYSAELDLDVLPRYSSGGIQEFIKKNLLIFFIKSAVVILLLTLFFPAFTAIVRNEIKSFNPTTSYKQLFIEVPEKVNLKFDSLTLEEKKRMEDSWKKLFENLKFLNP